MLIIRLQRVGRKNDPSFRIVLTDSRRAPKSGGFLEILGSYDARKGEPQFKAGRVKYWLSQGVKTSGTVHNLLVGAKLASGAKVRVSPLAKKPANVPADSPETPTVATVESVVEVPAAA